MFFILEGKSARGKQRIKTFGKVWSLVRENDEAWFLIPAFHRDTPATEIRRWVRKENEPHMIVKDRFAFLS